MNRQIWTGHFTQETVPPWLCPCCHRTTLAFRNYTAMQLGLKERDYRRPTAQVLWAPSRESREAIDRSIPEYEDDSEPVGPFAGLLECTNRACEEVLAIVGTHVWANVPNFDGDGTAKESYYTPKMAVPTIPMFVIPEGTLKTVSRAVTAAFGTFWSDPHATLSHIRSAVEFVLDQEGIPRSDDEEHRSLPDRIGQSRFSRGLGPHMNAIRKLGNLGAHDDDASPEDALNALELIEYILTEIHINPRQRIHDISNQVHRSDAARQAGRGRGAGNQSAGS